MMESVLQLAQKNTEEAYRLLHGQQAAESPTRLELAIREYVSGKYFFEKEDFPEALPFLASALHRLEEEDQQAELYQETCLLLVRIYRKIGDTPHAASLARAGIENLEKREKDALTLKLYLALAEIYMSTHNFPDALRNFRILYKKAAKLGDVSEMSEALFRIGNAYNWNEQLAEAEDFLQQAKEMKEKEGLDPSWVIASLGILYTKTKDFERSLSHFLECLALCEKNKDSALKCNVMKSMGNLYNLMGEPGKAIAILEAALPIAAAIPHKTVMMLCNQFLADAYELKKDFPKALDHYKEYFRLNEEIKKSNTDVQLKGMQLKYDVEEARKESEIYKLKNIDLVNANAEIGRQKQELGTKNREITDSIIYAQRIQQAILPNEAIFTRNLRDHFILYLPKDIVSGDFYWAAEFGSRFIFAVADCTGHGVPGAFLSLIAYNLLDRSVNELGITRPDAILNYLHQGIYKLFSKEQDASSSWSVKEGMDIAVCVTDREKKTLEYAGAFNPLYIVRDKSLHEIKADKIQLGSGSPATFTHHTIEVKPGDSFYIFSDGYADQFGGEKGKKFKYSRLKQLIAELSAGTMQDQSNALQNELSAWKGNSEQVDDICMIGFRPC